jgi:hypothetical protein
MPSEPRPDAIMTVAPAWVEAHCVIPDGFRQGEPFRLYRGQLTYFTAFYTVKGDIAYEPSNPVLAAAFRYRRGMEVAPQKTGKSPRSAAHVCLEGVGPSLFAGWAGADDGYACIDHGCGCGWEYPYEPDEPMGMLRPSPYIWLVGVSEDQTGNIYKALRPMIEKGPLRFLMPKTGEELIRLPGDGLVEPVTSNWKSRLGGRATFVVETEVGLYTKRNGLSDVADTLHRNLAGMGARASLESNAWDPAEHSVAQREYELVEKKKVDDVYVQVTWPPKNLSFGNKVDRRKIFRIVYPADTLRENGGHVEIESIEAEAAAMVEHDAAQASRFFGNGRETGHGQAFDVEIWTKRAVEIPYVVPRGTLCTIGYDGSKRWDHASMIATVVETGYQWPLGIWKPEDYAGHEIPAAAVTATLKAAMEHLDVWRVYADPPYWDETVAAWAGRWGKEVVLEWWTNRPKPMAYAIRAWHEAQTSSSMTHCATSDVHCKLFSEHVGNAYRSPTGLLDDERHELWVVTKDRDGSPAKIDSVPAAVLSWEARTDAIAAGALNRELEISAYATYHSLTGEDPDLDEAELDPSDPDLHGPFVDELEGSADLDEADVDVDDLVPA